MAERPHISDALREAVERTVQATVGTRDRAQDAASELSASVDDLVKGAEKGLTRSRRSVRAVVGERLPATQDDVKAIRAELRRIGKRLDSLEGRLPAATAKPAVDAKAKPAAKAKPKPTAKVKGGGTAKRAGRTNPKPTDEDERDGGARAKPRR